MDTFFETTLSTFRTSYRAEVINNEYKYIGCDTYLSYGATNLILNPPGWYTMDNIEYRADYQDGSTMIKSFEDNLNIKQDFVAYYDNIDNNWIFPDGSLDSKYSIVTHGINLENIDIHTNVLRQFFQYNNIEDIITYINETILPFIDIY